MIDIHRLPVWPAIRLPYRVARSLLELAVDKALGVETTLLNTELHVGLDQPADFKHRPVGWTTLWRVFRQLAPTSDDVLYDVGSGNGRPLIVARQFSFARVIGIELSTRMHEAAEANLAACRLKPKAPVELLNGDVLEQPIPAGTSIIYFYNPFAGDVFDRFVEHLLDELHRKPRVLRFIYTNPVEHAKLAANEHFRLVHVLKGWRPTTEWSRMLSTHFYEVLPPESAARPSASDRT